MANYNVSFKEIMKVEIDNNYVVEVSKEETHDVLYEFYLYHKNYGTKMLMFGMYEKYFPEETPVMNYILSVIEDNIEAHIEYYEEENF